jgi:hypothetical protein
LWTACHQKFPPFDTYCEQIVLNSLFEEQNEDFGLQLDPNPDLTRISEPVNLHGTGKTVLIGASHMKRLGAVQKEGSKQVEDHSWSGWLPSRENLKICEGTVKGLSHTDTVVLDLGSNSMY